MSRFTHLDAAAATAEVLKDAQACARELEKQIGTLANKAKVGVGAATAGALGAVAAAGAAAPAAPTGPPALGVGGVVCTVPGAAQAASSRARRGAP